MNKIISDLCMKLFVINYISSLIQNENGWHSNFFYLQLTIILVNQFVYIKRLLFEVVDDHS